MSIQEGTLLLGGRYALGPPVAAGGAATVHLGRMATDTGFARIVAIKRLHVRGFDEIAEEGGLYEEARILSRIRHPNVVPIVDLVRADQQLLLVMDYVLGQSVARLVFGQRGGAVEPTIAVGVAQGVLSALHAAHTASDPQGQRLGIVHRDVSPENILVGQDGLPRLLDFGIAKGKDSAESTRAGQLKGKMNYLPPEVVMGQPASVQADVYAAAVVLWEMLTGRRLFEVRRGEAQVDVLPDILQKEVLPPSRYAEGVSAELDAVVLTGLHRDLSARYPSATAFMDALDAVVEPATAKALSQWVWQRADEALEDRAAQMIAFESWAESAQASLTEASRIVATTVAPRRSLDSGATTEGPEGPLVMAVNDARDRRTELLLRRSVETWKRRFVLAAALLVVVVLLAGAGFI